MRFLATAIAVLVFAGACFIVVPAAANESKELRVAVVTGGHGFDRKAFLSLFESLEGIEFKHLPQRDDSEVFEDIEDWPYDVLVLYNMSRKISPKRQKNFLALLEKGVGVVMLHHAIANYPAWHEYRDIIGAAYFLEDTQEYLGKTYIRSQYTHDTDIEVHVEIPGHSVTNGLKDFTLNDETYRKWLLLPGSEVLLTTTHPESDKTLCWTRTYKNARVFCLQLGHSPIAFADENYRCLVGRGIQWAAEK